MESKSFISGWDRRSGSGLEQPLEKRIGVRKYVFWGKPGDEHNSIEDMKSNPLQVGPPMTLLSSGHHSRRPRRTYSSPTRFIPKTKNISLKKGHDNPMPDCVNTSVFKSTSKLLRPPILRPHSSPVRYNAIKQIYRDNDYDSMVSSEIKSPAVSLTNQKSHAYGFGAGEAYFSSRPPIAPIRLIVTGPMSSNSRVQRYLKAMREIEQTQKAEDRCASARSSIEITPPALSISSCSTPVKKQIGKNKKLNRFVRSMVSDIVLNLPLVHDAPVQVSNMRASPNMRDMRTSPKTKAKSNFGQFSDDYSRCSIAVQALIQDKSRTNTDISTIKSDRLGTEDWVGGVRALRDSHVRLVLRQLRHITCLNRALDRATKAGVPY